MKTAEPYGPSFAYFMDLSPESLGRGYAWYFNAISHSHWTPLLWFAVLTSSGVLAVVFRARLAGFLLGYILIALLPVVIFPNHRVGLFWYIPFFGVCGLAALAVHAIGGSFESRAQLRQPHLVASVLFTIACMLQFTVQERLNRDSREWAQGVASEYRSFVEGLRGIPSLPQDSTVYFRSVPHYFDIVTTRSAVQVVLGRTDVRIQIVPEFPRDALYRVSFDNGKLALERGK